jgi:hypothetical protein
MLHWWWFGLLWCFLLIQTYYSLAPKEHLPFFCFLIAILGVFVALIYRRKKKNWGLMVTSIPNDRMLKFYLDFLKMYQFEEKKLWEFWKRAIGGVTIGWTFFLWGEVFGKALFTHPGMICGYFFISLLIAVKGIEKGREIDSILFSILHKGRQIEQKLIQRGERGFNFFSKKQNFWPFFIRLIPFFFIIYPLVKFGLSPLFFKKFFYLEPPFYFLVEIVPVSLTLLACGFWIFHSYFTFYRKEKMTV